MHPFRRSLVTASRTILTTSLALVGMALPASGLLAQGTPEPILPSTIIPNYDRIRIGQVEGLEGGAYVARTGDASSNWYNPAGLAAAEGTSLNASANAYEFTTIKLEGLGTAYGSGRFKSLGTYFGAVIGSPVIDSPRLRLGFSFTRPVSWSPGAVTGAVTRDVPAGEESLGFYSQVQMNTMIPALGAGYRITERFRLGMSVSMAITSLTATQQLTNRLVSPTDVRRIGQQLSLDGQSMQVQFTAGAQWDVADALQLGAAITTAGSRLGGSALVALQTVSSGPAGSGELTFRDGQTVFDYQLPMKIVAGAAVRLGRLEFEADVRHYGSRTASDLLARDSTYTLVSTDASGVPTIDRESASPIIEEARAVTNLAVGANFPLSERWRIHGGVFTDQSPVANPETSLFRSVDLTGFGLAVSFGGRLSGTIGLSSSQGTTAERAVGPSLSGATTQTTVDIRTFNIHYALSYSFN